MSETIVETPTGAIITKLEQEMNALLNQSEFSQDDVQSLLILKAILTTAIKAAGRPIQPLGGEMLQQKVLGITIFQTRNLFETYCVDQLGILRAGNNTITTLFQHTRVPPEWKEYAMEQGVSQGDIVLNQANFVVYITYLQNYVRALKSKQNHPNIFSDTLTWGRLFTGGKSQAIDALEKFKNHTLQDPAFAEES